MDDIIFEVQGETFPANSHLFKAASEALSDIIESQLSSEDNNLVVLDNISLDTFKIIRELVTTGDVPDLWKHQESEIKQLLYQIRFLGLTRLKELSQDILKRYIERDNVISTLIEAHLSGWVILRNACYASINTLFLGVKFHETKPDDLAFEFLDFKENAIATFDKVKGLITHLIVRGNLLQQVEFSDVLRKCPLLIQLNVSTTLNFSDRIFDAPSNLKELDLSSCNFVTSTLLNRVKEKFPHLRGLNLNDNIQLDYNAWGVLSKFLDLTSLDISRNVQIRGDDFKLILQATPNLIDFDCSDCKNIEEDVFFELTRKSSRLIFLNLENTQISDGILIELAAKSPYLEEINVMKCNNLTDRGILEFAKQARALKKLKLSESQFEGSVLKEIQHQKPYLDKFSD